MTLVFLSNMDTVLLGRNYKLEAGTVFKLCGGPLHKDGGEWLTLDRFWINKSGARAGRPIPKCKACERMERFGTTERGLVEVSKVWWIFLEINRRVGKAEACRLIGVSYNFWTRVEKKIYIRMYKRTAIRAVRVLRELRENNTVRHRDSIAHGSAMRGHKEKVPTTRRDYYKPQD